MSVLYERANNFFHKKGTFCSKGPVVACLTVNFEGLNGAFLGT